MTAHVCHVFPSFVGGGAQVRTARLMNAFGGRFRHSVVSLDGATTARELVDPAVALELVAAPPRAGSLRTVLGLRRLFRRIRPDLVCTYNWGAIDAVVAARLSPARGILHHEDGFGPEEAAGQLPRRVWIRRLVLPLASALIVPARSTLRIAREQWRVGARRVHHVAIGIDVEAFPAGDGHPELRARLGIRDDAWVFGFVGHLRPEKNPARIVEAFGRLLRAESRGAGFPRPPHLVLLGDGPERGPVEELVRTHGLEGRVSLVGYQSAPQPYYRLMDALTISSNTEAMPINLLEGMASHLPVAATDVGDVRCMLPPEQASLVTPIGRGDEEATLAGLVASLETLARDPVAAAALGDRNHAHVARVYSFQGMCRAFAERYDAALGIG